MKHNYSETIGRSGQADRWMIRTTDGVEWFSSREDAEASLLDWFTTVLHDTGEAPDESGDLLLVVGSAEEIVGATRDEDSERGEWLRDRGLDYEVTGYRLREAPLTPAELRALLRAHPAEALEAMADVRIAGPWVEQDLIPQWCRLRSPGMVTPDESTGHWMAWARRRLGTYPTIAEAQAASDAHLLAEGWVLVGGAE